MTVDAHTIKDAHQICCPFHVAKTCRADECMAWQWYAGEYERVRTLGGHKPKDGVWEKQSVTLDGDWIWRRRIERRGFCRLCTPERARCVECLAPRALLPDETVEVK